MDHKLYRLDGDDTFSAYVQVSGEELEEETVYNQPRSEKTYSIELHHHFEVVVECDDQPGEMESDYGVILQLKDALGEEIFGESPSQILSRENSRLVFSRLPTRSSFDGSLRMSWDQATLVVNLSRICDEDDPIIKQSRPDFCFVWNLQSQSHHQETASRTRSGRTRSSANVNSQSRRRAREEESGSEGEIPVIEIVERRVQGNRAQTTSGGFSPSSSVANDHNSRSEVQFSSSQDSRNINGLALSMDPVHRRSSTPVIKIKREANLEGIGSRQETPAGRSSSDLFAHTREPRFAHSLNQEEEGEGPSLKAQLKLEKLKSRELEKKNAALETELSELKERFIPASQSVHQSSDTLREQSSSSSREGFRQGKKKLAAPKLVPLSSSSPKNSFMGSDDPSEDAKSLHSSSPPSLAEVIVRKERKSQEGEHVMNQMSNRLGTWEETHRSDSRILKRKKEYDEGGSRKRREVEPSTPPNRVDEEFVG